MVEETGTTEETTDDQEFESTESTPDDTNDVTQWTDEQLRDFGRDEDKPSPVEEVEKVEPEKKAEEVKQPAQPPYQPQPQPQQVSAIQQRKQMIQARLEEIKQIDPADQVINDPKGFREMVSEQAKLEAELREVTSQEVSVELTRRSLHNQQQITTRRPDFMNILPDVIEAAREAGEPLEMLEQLRARPFSMNAAPVLMYAAQAELKKEKARHAEEIKQLKDAHAKAITGLQGGRQTVTNTGGSGGDHKLNLSKLSEKDIEKMSDAELKEFAKQLGKKGR